MLPSKTIPEVKNRKHHTLKPRTTEPTTTAAPPRKKARVMSGTEVEDSPRASGGTAAATRATISPTSSFHMSYPVPAKVCNALLIHWFALMMFIDCEDLKKESNLLFLWNCCEQSRWNSRRRRRCPLSLFAWCSQDFHHQKIDEKQS